MGHFSGRSSTFAVDQHNQDVDELYRALIAGLRKGLIQISGSPDALKGKIHAPRDTHDKKNWAQTSIDNTTRKKKKTFSSEDADIINLECDYIVCKAAAQLYGENAQLNFHDAGSETPEERMQAVAGFLNEAYERAHFGPPRSQGPLFDKLDKAVESVVAIIQEKRKKENDKTPTLKVNDKNEEVDVLCRALITTLNKGKIETPCITKNLAVDWADHKFDMPETGAWAQSGLNDYAHEVFEPRKAKAICHEFDYIVAKAAAIVHGAGNSQFFDGRYPVTPEKRMEDAKDSLKESYGELNMGGDKAQNELFRKLDKAAKVVALTVQPELGQVKGA